VASCVLPRIRFTTIAVIRAVKRTKTRRHRSSPALAAIRRRLERAADATYRIRDFVPTGGAVLNVRVPVIREIVVDYLEDSRPHLEEAIELLNQASRSRVREEILFGVVLLARFKKAFTADVWQHVDGWVDSIDNWETCDQLATNIVGELVAR
jgi:3-methyladenine DNA glycosylase AlkD